MSIDACQQQGRPDPALILLGGKIRGMSVDIFQAAAAVGGGCQRILDAWILLKDPFLVRRTATERVIMQ